MECRYEWKRKILNDFEEDRQQHETVSLATHLHYFQIDRLEALAARWKGMHNEALPPFQER